MLSITFFLNGGKIHYVRHFCKVKQLIVIIYRQKRNRFMILMSTVGLLDIPDVTRHTLDIA